MRRVIKPVMVAGIVVICLVVVTGSLYAYLSLHARRIFNSQIGVLTQSRVQARVVRSAFPVGLIVEDLSIEGLLTCERAKMFVDITSLFGRDVHIRTLELTRPVLTWERSLSSSQEGEAALKVQPVPAGSPKNVILAQLLVHDGVLKVTTHNAAGEVKERILDGIQLRARNVPLTDRPARTEFFLTSSLAKLDVPFVGNFLKAGGWFNWAAKDMDAAVQVTDDSGKVGVDAKVASRQNEMTVSGNVILAGAQEPQATGKKSGMVENVVLNMMMLTNTDVEMDFSFTTKMDRVDIGTVNLSGHITTGLNSHATSGNIVAGLKAAGEELLKATEEPGLQK
jgi:hypothetical protein